MGLSSDILILKIFFKKWSESIPLLNDCKNNDLLFKILGSVLCRTACYASLAKT